jgi:serine/threonine protein kinase
MPGEQLLGSTLGAYRVEGSIGSGATGVVYRAVDVDSARPVALKVLHDNLGSISGLERRFSREARVLAKLSHPNIVEVLDFGVEQGRTFIALELLEGETLEEALARGPIDPARALAYYDPILAALAEAHEHEVVHRDLKPANVFLTKDGAVKILDFGLAKMLSVEELSHEGTLTRKGRIVGTPAYMAPEQITGVSIDVRADVYALGVMLYELLADRRPFLYERRSELLRAHLLEPVPEITGVREGLWLHPALEALLARALAKDPYDRFANGRAMLEALRALPTEAVRVEGRERTTSRTRTGSSSTFISESERRALTESLGSSSARATVVNEPFVEERGLPTAALLALSAGLLAIAAALWLALMR